MSVSVDAKPQSDIDLHTDEALLDPYPLWAELRAAGGAVWMSRYDMFALSRYDDVRAALSDWETYSSSRGVSFNSRKSEVTKGIVLQSDPPEHQELRRVLHRPLAAKALRELEAEFVQEAEHLVGRLVEKESFEAVSELAQHLPVTIVSRYVGLPEDGRQNMLEWAGAVFNCAGPMEKERTRAAFPIIAEEVEYFRTQAVPGKLTPGGWGQGLYDAAERGEISVDKCPVMMHDYVNPSLDTTINAIASGVWLFGQNPEQWDLVRQDLSLIPAAVNEIVRMESPIPAFTRFVQREHVVDGTTLPVGSRAMILYGSANRDERKWTDPERFDVRREGVAQQLGWGAGGHACLGMGLARLEMKAIFTALARSGITRFELGTVERELNMTLRGLRRVDVTVKVK